ncbi:anti-sigma factor domain-containing protein [Paenibacillus sinopodophylli]|uniref:anti-sigma factor domain-containing protein n=1 Tax=Paenibacillus sinopodophylli TaxID=1837342 RepID=UPI0014871DD5|nr:anti-sigma factor [Paenibacillus sinopodophylli]
MSNPHTARCEDVEMYVLGGLDDEDKLAFEAHGASCIQCQRKMEELVELFGMMPLTVEPVAPPPGMKARILAAVAQSERADAQTLSTSESTNVPVIPVPKPITEKMPVQAMPRKKVKSWTTPLLAGAAAALLLVSTVLYQRVDRLNGDSEQLAAQVQELQQQLAAAEQPPTGIQVNNVVALTPTVPDIVAQGLATIVIDANGMHLIVQAENLPKLTNDEAFQVWLLKEGKPVNAGTFLTNDGTGALYYTFKPDEYDQIAITHEPDARGSQPRGEIVLAGKLAAL